MIQWLPWAGDAFARAAREGKPVLLSITAAWCRACHEMDRTTYADRDVAALVNDRFIAVRVDTDRRPDINERYNLGGWPTTAFLTPAGDLMTGGTFVSAERMPLVLERVAAEYSAASSALANAATADAVEEPAGETSDVDDATLVARIFASFDEDYGGFGIEPKFPHTAPLHLAIVLLRETSDPRWETIVVRTLDAMAGGGLWDDAAGGFYRYASTRDWQLPHREKLLETNAALLRVFAEAALVLGRDQDRERCRDIAAFITTTLRTDHGYAGSDAESTIYVDANATAAGALLGAATVLDDSDLAREAMASFERVALTCYKPGLGMAHYFDGEPRVRGLLADQVAVIAALLDAYDVSADEPYRMMAEELSHIIVRDLWDPAAGGFFDRAPSADDVGLLRQQPGDSAVGVGVSVVERELDQLEARG